MTLTIVLAAVLVLVAIWAIATYNGLVRARNRVDESWSGIDVQLLRRADLVPNLVEVVKGYAAHEAGTLERVTQARAATVAAQARDAREHSEDELSGSLVELAAVAERYPDLKASRNFIELQSALAEVENEIQAARKIYNSNVAFLNTRVQSFPSSLVARLGSMRERSFFEIEVSSERRAREPSFA